MSLRQAQNFSERKRETPDGDPLTQIVLPPVQEDDLVVEPQDDPPVVVQPHDPPVVQIDDEPVVTPHKEEQFLMAKPHLVIVGADKGGVGKTFVSRATLDYFASQGIKARAFDTQQPDGNLVRFHPDQTEVVDLSNPDDQIKVFDSVAEHDVTVIDIQASLLTPTLTLLRDIGLLDMVKDGKLDVTVLHIIGSTVQSLNEIAGTAKILEGSRHFIVMNHTNNAAFFEGVSGIDTAVLKSGSALIDIPMLVARYTEFVEVAATSFSDYAKNGKSLVAKGMVGKWLKEVYAQFDAAKLHIR